MWQASSSTDRHSSGRCENALLRRGEPVKSFSSSVLNNRKVTLARSHQGSASPSQGQRKVVRTGGGPVHFVLVLPMAKKLLSIAYPVFRADYLTQVGASHTLL